MKYTRHSVLCFDLYSRYFGLHCNSAPDIHCMSVPAEVQLHTDNQLIALHYRHLCICYPLYTEVHDLQALNGGRRLVAHHPGVLGPQLHSFVLLALPSVEALRSTTTKIKTYLGMLLLPRPTTYLSTVSSLHQLTPCVQYCRYISSLLVYSTIAPSALFL